MYSPAPRWGWARYLVWAAAGVLLLLEFGARYLPRHTAPPVTTARPRLPTFGRVSIPNIPPDSDARFDDAIVATVAQRPDANTAHGCWRLRGLGNDAGTMDRMECRLEGDTVHLFEVRHRSGEPELWRITIPGENGESILVH